MKYSNNFIVLIALSLFIFSCSTNKQYEIVLSNPSSIDLVDKAVVIPKSEINDSGKKAYPVILNEKGDTIPSQLDDLDGDGSWDELFFVTNIPANGKVTATLSWIDKEPVYTKRTSVRFGKRDSKDTPVYPKTSDTLTADKIHTRLGYQPYQTDGPSWENDKVGFRHYFDGRNAKDLFGKKTSAMSPETVGINASGAVEDNYHVMADWGRDVLGVGNSVGIGGITLMVGDSLTRIGNVAGDSVTNFESAVFTIITEGPARSIIKFNYNNWKPLDRKYQVQEKTSIWPGMYAYQNAVSVSGLKGDENLLVGLVNSNTKDSLEEIMVNDKWVVLFTHDQQTYEKQWWLGMALILPKDAYIGYGEAPKSGKFASTFYGKLRVENDKPITYYAVGTWELSDEKFKERDYFKNYVTNLTEQISADVRVEVRKK